jgi:CRISPR-associated protein Cas5t
MLCLRIRAPFAAFRTFTTGAYRPTMPFMPPSAAYGLVLGLAGIDTRFDDGKSSMTLMKPSDELPSLDIAIGVVNPPDVQTIFQQLHNYPVGASGKEHKEATKGSKYNIQPVRREILVGLDAVVCVRTPADSSVGDKVREALAGKINARHGLPFLGDNNLLPDSIAEDTGLNPARWYRRLTRDEILTGIAGTRFTIWIDRATLPRTVGASYALEENATEEPPSSSAYWTTLPPR